ncbi:putative toxin-antitoxin system toxin component, PIN family [Planktothrix sp. FACHB-1365]|uniref:putative toxin-antitoxin system toxin component, PIN family n=1 Tax=Planktothrix sp. FACHB-1365 TaxID=2692855 RepID=UPI001688C25A|nr:putative toxin-antitoxin system toxin component, PIN family [Planktothrix sp. FACHB-1365]MBD2483492.1 putative toxin-antitoxin system toxin component, PIN family [Planktothrix sp. FACHB-1365]
MNKLKIVFDCNVVISAFLFKNSYPRLALEKAKKYHIILVSDSIIQELETVIKRNKFDRYISMKIREELLKDLIVVAEQINPNELITDCRDPKDNKYLELAVSGKAQYIITGDKDLLILNPFREIKILQPDEFLSIT